jgi:hypothetical protein
MEEVKYITEGVCVPILVTPVANHADIKDKILEGIKQMGTHSLIETPKQKIFNSDWHLQKSYERPYAPYIDAIIKQVYLNILECHEIPKDNISHECNFWFQQYKKGDYHQTHSHPSSSFSSVYYVDLQGNTPKTSFFIRGKEIELTLPLEEGQVVSFPSFLCHGSKPNKSDRVKTIISWNYI